MTTRGSGGDQGRTSLLSGERVAKSHRRIEACGDVDELSCILGACAASLPDDQREVKEEIAAIQGDLFILGARLATTPRSPAAGLLAPFPQERTEALAQATERLDRGLPVLQGFVIPGGHSSAAWAHVARAVCRRAERHVVRLFLDPEETEAAAEVDTVIPYLNRLSGYLFALARHCNDASGVPERLWRA